LKPIRRTCLLHTMLTVVKYLCACIRIYTSTGKAWN
jgi:hypothetical protein